MGPRVRIAVSACFVVAGLILGGIGGAIALADPEPDPGDAQDPQSDTSVDDGRDGSPVDGQASQQEQPTDNPRTSDKPPRPSSSKEDPPPSSSREDPPPSSSSDKPTPSSSSDKPTPSSSSETSPRPPTTDGGDSDFGGFEVPRGLPDPPPAMQLPPPREVQPAVPGEPGVGGTVPVGVGAAAAVPSVLSTLPVVVLPTVVLNGGGAAPAGPAGLPPLPAGPRVGTAEPPAALEPFPASVGDNVVVAASYRLGYAEYLRTAGMSQLVGLALPGVAGMLVMTGAGGVIGYRQAKAGHVVRTGRAARFVS